MWNNLTKQQKIDSIQLFAGCLRERTIFNIIAINTRLVQDLIQANQLFDDIKFIQDEGYSLGLIEVQLKTGE